jgi:hypothetical protein
MRHCRFCGNTGHNRRTCPSRSQDSKTADKDYHNRYRSKHRRCRYCNEFDHDRRKCVKLKDDRITWTKENAEYRKLFIEDCKQHGFGVGAMLVSSYKKDEFYFIKSINWESINKSDSWNYCVSVLDLAAGRETRISAPSFYGKTGNERTNAISYGGDYKVEHLADTSNLEKFLPSGWLDGLTSNDRLPSYLR